MNPKKGKDLGDHPPITPTANIPSGLGGTERLIYDFVATNFLASVAQDLKYEETGYQLNFGPHRLSWNEKILKQEGFKCVAKNDSWRNEYVSSNMNYDRVFGSVAKMVIQQKMTQPEKPMTETQLLGLMEKYGIGTDASMATHIKNVIGNSKL